MSTSNNFILFLKRTYPALLAVPAAMLWAAAAGAATTTASIPVYLEYPLLQSLLVSQMFDTPDGKREILNDPGDCNRIVLSDPRVGARGDDVEILANVNAKLGVDAFGNCLDLINWHGAVTFLGRPVIQANARSIALEPQKLWLVDADGGNILSGRLWDAGSARLMAFFGSFVLDLGTQLQALGALLPDVLPGRSREQLQLAMDRLTLADLRVGATSLDLAVNIGIETLPEVITAPPELTAEELQQFENHWQMMDALLVSAVKHYAAATALQPLRSSLLDILIDSRYRLRDLLNEPAGPDGDAVRSWFIDSWHGLMPVVRAIAREQPGQEQLLWFKAITAADALYVMNQLGASIGLEVSSAGLRRLARMLNAGDSEELLRYGEEADPQLQELLREETAAAESDLSAWLPRFSLFAHAHAAAATENLNQWLPVRGKLDIYLPKVEDLLEKTAKNALQPHDLAADYRSLYEKLVLATAWQESCWRQFVVIKKRIEPLRSSSGDVGLMQVNERVWRGFYDLQKLRWDVNYNSASGSEILLNYLLKYALRRNEQKQPGGIANLARASYSAYNGGPRQVARYRTADVAATHKKVDSLFWDKYQQVDAGKARNVAGCLGEDLAGSGS